MHPQPPTRRAAVISVSLRSSNVLDMLSSTKPFLICLLFALLAVQGSALPSTDVSGALEQRHQGRKGELQAAMSKIRSHYGRDYQVQLTSLCNNLKQTNATAPAPAPGPAPPSPPATGPNQGSDPGENLMPGLPGTPANGASDPGENLEPGLPMMLGDEAAGTGKSRISGLPVTPGNEAGFPAEVYKTTGMPPNKPSYPGENPMPGLPKTPGNGARFPGGVPWPEHPQILPRNEASDESSEQDMDQDLNSLLKRSPPSDQARSRSSHKTEVKKQAAKDRKIVEATAHREHSFHAPKAIKAGAGVGVVAGSLLGAEAGKVNAGKPGAKVRPPGGMSSSGSENIESIATPPDTPTPPAVMPPADGSLPDTPAPVSPAPIDPTASTVSNDTTTNGTSTIGMAANGTSTIVTATNGTATNGTATNGTATPIDTNTPSVSNNVTTDTTRIGGVGSGGSSTASNQTSPAFILPPFLRHVDPQILEQVCELMSELETSFAPVPPPGDDTPSDLPPWATNPHRHHGASDGIPPWMTNLNHAENQDSGSWRPQHWNGSAFNATWFNNGTFSAGNLFNRTNDTWPFGPRVVPWPLPTVTVMVTDSPTATATITVTDTVTVTATPSPSPSPGNSTPTDNTPQ